MSYIFIDESGDLGFNFKKKNTSKFFIVTFLAIASKRSFEKIVAETHRNLRKKYKMRSGTLHAAHEEAPTRKRLCKRIAEKDCKIMVIYLDKEKIFTKLNEEKEVLYNFITNILLDRIFNKGLIGKAEPVKIIASRRETNRFLNENFQNYLREQVSKNHNIPIDVLIKTPDEEKVLQLADMISWAIFRKYEHADSVYYNLLKDRIVEESSLYQ
jgi:undecaprenyl pyrophosphate synthase